MGAAMEMRMALVSAIVALTAVMFWLSGLGILSFLSSEVPRMYGSLLSWLVPPYLYIIINGIILSIAASSRFHKVATEDVDLAPVIPTTELTTPAEYVVESVDAEESQGVLGVYYKVAVGDELIIEEGHEEKEKEKEFVLKPREEESGCGGDILTRFSLAEEKPLVSSRFGNHRKTVKATTDHGKALRVVPRSKRNETLESTWRTITDGRPVPLARHLKKPDTWDALHGPAASPVRKTETFSERRPASPGGTSSSAGRIRREPSLGQDDLNRRVEAFINKFNEEMRLQREESLKQYHDMLNRASLQ
ncbi:hypothetical protein IHE45_15G129300 [Dioscorea alata]|uniref:Uncharacterized protein n=1 Tax=Dioscorea alata TaxID=55571 RepID=A0ACB7UPD9_DIOAL|nr:hypothetical protein IHE45_15G129300 [Dioscorea alata]